MKCKDIRNVLIDEKNVGQRLDFALSLLFSDLTRQFVQKLISQGAVLLNGKLAKASRKLNLNDRIIVSVPEPKELALVAKKMEIEIVFQDEDILVINKPPNLVVHPSESGGHMDDSLVSGLLHILGDKLSAIGGVKRPGIVHRLDKDTSGLMIIAKTDFAHQVLMKTFKDRNVKKFYISLVSGSFDKSTAMIDMPIGRSSVNRKQMTVNGLNSRDARTRFEVLEQFKLLKPNVLKAASLLKIELFTGRTHQIRVHMKAIGHSLIGDQMYGNNMINNFFLDNYGLKRQFLHASELYFEHPRTKEKLSFKAELSNDLQAVLDQLRSLN